ncbi:MAG: hypothetical protein WCT32_02060 [Patescibacteria group bacterium]|jgi:hypothetical protein
MKKDTGTYFINLISLLGAGILGFGLGAYSGETFSSYAAWIIVLGIMMHGGAMLKNHK